MKQNKTFRVYSPERKQKLNDLEDYLGAAIFIGLIMVYWLAIWLIS